MTIRQTAPILSILLVLLFGIAPEAQAPIALKLDKRAYREREDVVVTVVFPEPGKIQLEQPRFHFIPDRAPLPPRNSRGWVAFQPMSATQAVTLIAPEGVPPEEEQKWWLLLDDGDRLVARVPLDVHGWFVALEIKAEELRRRIDADAAARSSGTPAPTASTTNPVAPELKSAKGLMSVAASGDLLLGEQIVVSVRLAVGAGETTLPTLRWGASADLDWESKAKAPEPDDTSGAVLARTETLPQSVTVRAPLSKPGRYDLRLFRGKELLDVITLTVAGLEHAATAAVSVHSR